MKSEAERATDQEFGGRARHLGLDPSTWLYIVLVPVVMVCADPSEVPVVIYAGLLGLGSIAIHRRRKNRMEGDSHV